MSRIHAGQLRARRLSRWEKAVDLLQGVPRTLAEAKLSLRMLGMYRQIGWQRSASQGMPVDEDGFEVPWFSYPAVMWLASVLQGSERVFEYGSGNSTVWLARRAASVVSVEHDEAWVKLQSDRFGANVDLLHRPCLGDEDWAPSGDAYVDALSSYDRGQFDIIVVDGMARNSCMQVASTFAQGSEVVIVDNTDRPAYRRGINALQEDGFGRIDFVGPNLVQGVFSCTSAFSRGLPAALQAHSCPRFWGF